MTRTVTVWALKDQFYGDEFKPAGLAFNMRPVEAVVFKKRGLVSLKPVDQTKIAELQSRELAAVQGAGEPDPLASEPDRVAPSVPGEVADDGSPVTRRRRRRGTYQTRDLVADTKP